MPTTRRGGAQVLRRFHPAVREWFTETLGTPSDPQRAGWPAIASGEHTLILAPTGTGKTLAAFLWELNALIVEGLEEPLANGIHLLYISPLKALNNDIRRNLENPLAALHRRFEKEGIKFPELRVAVRTGDTPASARARMLRKSPHILITTPESLNIMLTSVRGRGMFATTRAVIVDEIHALAGSKRGAHLVVTLERLEELVEKTPQRIGLSATQRPLDEIARFLGGKSTGGEESQFRPVRIVNCGLTKRMELQVESPVPDLGKVGGSVWPSVAPLLLRHIADSRTTLIFVNNRAQAEKIATRVNALAEQELAQPYHGSLSRERRLALEERLKAGELRALVTTSSLELGIDIGSVDLVIQLQSPKRVAAGLQRVGRAGHTLGAASRGILVPTFRDDAMEIAAIVAAMRAGEVEPTRVVQNALDVLAQTMVATVSVDDWKADDLFQMVRRAYPYHRLTRTAFDEVLSMLSGKYPSDIASELESRITWDRVTGRVSGDRAARMTAVISGGTIPDRGLYTVNLPDRTRLGELDEEFVHESRVGDAFQLGSTTWRIAAIEHDRVVVTPAPGMPARMPFWHGEYGARSLELSRRVGELRRELAAGADEKRLESEYGCDAATAHTLSEYVSAQRAATGIVPDDRNIVIEHFRDETGSVRIVIHAAFGGRVNAPWGMALAQRAREAIKGSDVQVQTTDDGIMLRLPDLGSVTPVAALLDLTVREARQLVMEEVGATSLFGARFRMNAARALLLPRGNPRRRMPLWLQRLKALDLLETVRQFPSFPILVETYRDVLQDAFDMPGLEEVLGWIESGAVRVHVVQTLVPSPFAASLQFGFVMDWMYGDDTPRAEQRAAILSLDRSLLGEVMGDAAGDELTLEAIRQIVDERSGRAQGRKARSVDDLANLLDRAGDLTYDELAERVADEEAVRERPLEELIISRRAIAVPFGKGGAVTWRFILTESYPRYVSAFGKEALGTIRVADADMDVRYFDESSVLREVDAATVVPESLLSPVVTRTAARREILARFVALAGPVTVGEIVQRYGLDDRWVEERLTEWQRTGTLVCGRFRVEVTEPEWCSRRVAETARRRALAAIRKQIEAVPLAAFAELLQRWQHVDPRDKLRGVDGIAMVLAQLYGLSRPATAWERDYLRARVDGYDSSWLSQVSARGNLLWVGEPSASATADTPMLSRVRFMERGTGGVWLPGDVAVESAVARLSDEARSVYRAIETEGASFLGDLQSATGLDPAVVKGAIRELVAAGLVTNDTIEALREVIRWRALSPRNQPDPTRWLPTDYSPSPDRRIVQRRPSVRRLPRWKRPDRPGGGIAGWTGRWSLVHRLGPLGPVRSEEQKAEEIARKWLERYGIVSREVWRRERPPTPWRSIYRELKRLEFRGEARRGYFVKGLTGAQFAMPGAVELLRTFGADGSDETEAPFVVLAAGDPANVYAWPIIDLERDPLSKPRGTGALLVTRRARVALSVEGRGRNVIAADWLTRDELTKAKEVLASHLRGEKGARYLMLPDIRTP